MSARHDPNFLLSLDAFELLAVKASEPTHIDSPHLTPTLNTYPHLTSHHLTPAASLTRPAGRMCRADRGMLMWFSLCQHHVPERLASLLSEEHCWRTPRLSDAGCMMTPCPQCSHEHCHLPAHTFLACTAMSQCRRWSVSSTGCLSVESGHICIWIL